MELAILDLGVFPRVKDASLKTIEESIALAQYAESRNFNRFWITEHHAVDASWRSTETMIALLAASTSRIKIGAAGVLVKYHNPLLTAQNFKLLNNLFNNRIDLGYAKGGVDSQTEQALQPESITDTFYEKIIKTRRFLTNSYAQTGVYIPPENGQIPEQWILGSNLATLEFALQHGFNCCLSLCHRAKGIQSREDFDQYYRLTHALREQGLKIGILTTVVLSSDQQSELDTNDPVFTTLDLNFRGSAAECNEFITDTCRSYQPDVLAFGNIYSLYAVRTIHLDFLARLMGKNKL